jgi:hypothetical protein
MARWRPRRLLPVLLLAFTAATLGARVPAQSPGTSARPAVAAEDEEFARLVREWTTRPEFLSPLVDHLPKSATVPSPKDVLGYHIGAPKKLTYYADILRYYRTLAAKSPRVVVESIGRTDEGRECVVVIVSSEDTIRNLEQYRGYLRRLSDPRGLSEAEAREIIAKAKPMYHLIGGLHSGETGPSEMLMELAYRLAVEESPLIQQIRDHVIVSLTPVAEPDGRDRYIDWYYRYNVDVENENERIPGPPYWGKYVLHDNNRDINFSQVTMKTLLDWYLGRWRTPIMHELHESIPFMYTYSGQAPQNPNYDPILFGELPWFSNFEMTQMIKWGMPGVWTHAFMDAWSPGYLGSIAYNHNGMMRMYETFGNGGATTMRRRVGGRGGRGEGGEGGEGEGGRGSQTSREWYRPLPPYTDVVWSMRNNTNYMETGVLLGLQLTASFPQVILENFYVKSRNAIESGRTTPPHGFIIPAGQRDMTRVARLVNLLRLQGIEVGRATGEVTLADGTYPRGSFIVKRDQPYGRLAKILLEKQEYPDPNLRTYDDSGWTMGWMLHVDVKATRDKAVLDVPVEPVDEVRLAGSVTGVPNPTVIAVAHYGSTNMITLRWRLKDLPVKAIERGVTAGEVELPPGSFLVPVASDQVERVRRAVVSLGLTGVALAAPPEVPTHELDLPRVAVYSTWGSTQDPGWVRHAFDSFEIPYDLIYKERVKQGDLRAAYDVIVIPSQAGSAKGLVYDIAPRGKPIAYTKTERFKYLGMYGESEDITGGMGLDGVVALQKFVEAGGVLLTLGAASYFPPEFGLTRTINASRPSAQFYAPRPIVQAEILRSEHPIFYGYAEKIVPTKYTNGPLLQVPASEQRYVLMRYPGGDESVLSGLMRGANEIRNRPAIVDVPVGRGRVVLYATNPIYRWQNHGEFNMVFNALLNYNDWRAPTETSDPARAAREERRPSG